MYLQTFKKDKETIHRVHSLNSDVPLANIKDTFEMLFTDVVFHYVDHETIHIPYIGEMKIQHVGDKLVDGYREAVLEIKIEPSTFLKKIIGQIEDGETVTDLDKAFVSKVISDMEDKVNDI
jgi:hypothetical protein